MSESVGQLAKRLEGWIVLRIFPCLMVLSALTGCFGPASMHFDIQEYNKQVVSSEKEMILYNIAALHEHQPPHFMMLSNIAQTRHFSASASFQWNHLWNSLPLALTGTTAHGSNTYQTTVGGSATEDPTFSFVPIQGNDFALRFESPVTDKLSYFIQKDLNFNVSPQPYGWLMLLFAQALVLYHSDAKAQGHCTQAQYFNDSNQLNQPDKNYYDQFWNCVQEIMIDPQTLNFVQIDATHRFSTASPKDQPGASDILQALQVNKKWVQIHDKAVLVDSIKIPAWLDYPAKFVDPADSAEPNQKLAEELTPVWWSSRERPNWRKLAYNLPSKYQWYKWQPGRKGDKGAYVLLPEGDVLYNCDAGDSKSDWDKLKNCYPIPLTKHIAKTEEEKRRDEQTKQQAKRFEFSYGDKIVENLWPIPEDFLYVELRKNQVGDAEAERECADWLPSGNNVVCGIFKIGNLLQIMKRLGEMACTSQNKVGDACPESSIFEIGSKAPWWAANSAPYTRIPAEWIWVPAHNPYSQARSQLTLAERDNFIFFTLYKLYQMSLVDTSKLVTGTIPVTISK